MFQRLRSHLPVPRIGGRSISLVVCLLLTLSPALAQRPNILWTGKHQRDVQALSFSPDGKTLASGSYDQTIKIWNVNNGSLLGTLTGHTDGIYTAPFSPDGTILASGGGRFDGTIKFWNVADWTLIRSFPAHIENVVYVAFAPDGKTLASCGVDTKIKLWNVADCTLLRTITGHNTYVDMVIFSPDGKILASASDDRTVKLWNVADCTLLRTLTGHTDAVLCIAFSPDGKILASGGSYNDRTIKLWNVANGSLIRTLTGHSTYIAEVAFSPDGKKLLSAGPGGVKIWNVADGNLLQNYDQGLGDGIVVSLALSPDGSRFACGSQDGTVVLAYLDFTPPTVSGTVNLEGCVNSVQPVFFLLMPRQAGNAFVRTLLLDAQGQFTLKNFPVGIYDVWLKGPKWLAKRFEIDAHPGSVSLDPITLLGGDANNDNSVDIYDLAFVAESFNTEPPDPAWNPQADLTCDNTIDIFDLALIAENYNTNGDW